LKNGKLLRTGTIDEIIGNQESTLVKIGAEDKMLLTEIVNSNPEMTIYKQSAVNDLMIISVSKNTKSDQINRYFFDKGIVLNQLDVYNESLENQFLDIIRES